MSDTFCRFNNPDYSTSVCIFNFFFVTWPVKLNHMYFVNVVNFQSRLLVYVAIPIWC